MIRHSEQMRVETQNQYKGGKRTTTVIDIVQPEELHGVGRLFGVSIIPPGGSIGRHKHEGDFETYYILKGKARVDDNGKNYELNPGDMVQCGDGDYHAIESIGDEDLEYIALILFSVPKENFNKEGN